MKYTTKSIKRTLEKNINEISVHPELFVKNPGRDFTRTRKLSFKQTIKAIVSMSGKSLRGEIMDYFNMDISAPTVSAFVQQRNKISYHTFEALFHSFTNAIDEQKLYRGYRLLAVAIYYFCIMSEIPNAYNRLLSILSRIDVSSIPFSLGNKFKEILLKFAYDKKLQELISKNKPLMNSINGK